MVEEIQKFTKLTFIIHFVIAIIFTILFWMPEFTSSIYQMTYTVESGAVTMVLAATFVGLTVSSLCGIFAKEWKQVKIVVILEIAWLIAGLIAAIINFNVFGLMIILNLVIFIVLLLLFLLTYLQQEDKMKPLLK